MKIMWCLQKLDFRDSHHLVKLCFLDHQNPVHYTNFFFVPPIYEQYYQPIDELNPSRFALLDHDYSPILMHIVRDTLSINRFQTARARRLVFVFFPVYSNFTVTKPEVFVSFFAPSLHIHTIPPSPRPCLPRRKDVNYLTAIAQHPHCVSAATEMFAHGISLNTSKLFVHRSIHWRMKSTPWWRTLVLWVLTSSKRLRWSNFDNGRSTCADWLMKSSKKSR